LRKISKRVEIVTWTQMMLLARVRPLCLRNGERMDKTKRQNQVIVAQKKKKQFLETLGLGQLKKG
jgi:hypothetical protein